MDYTKQRRRQLLKRARRMRKNPTLAESKLWSRVRGKKLDGLKFRRQHVLAPYIVDFYCASKRVVVEIDGPKHQEQEAVEYDQDRTDVLTEEYGVQVLRFDAWRVLKEIDEVLVEIRVMCEEEAQPG
jgi:very-short-patch-repair endonuclease